MKNRVLYIALIFLNTLACKEDTLNRGYPVVHTNPVGDISTTGATFRGTFSNTKISDVTDHGFVWSTSKNLSLAASFVKRLGIPVSNDFQANIVSLLPGGTVYVRAFVISKTTTVYGNLQEFGSNGTGEVTIIDFSPKSGKAGDTLTIKGTGFSENPSFDKIDFLYDGKVTALKVAKVNSTQIKALIPANIFHRTMTVQVTIASFSKQMETPFEYKSPGLVSIQGVPTLCDTLTINWESYGSPLASLLINKIRYAPKKVTSSQIKVIFETFSQDLDIQINTGIFTDEKKFHITTFSPNVTSSFQDVVAINDTLVFALNFAGCNSYPSIPNSYAGFQRAGGTDRNPKYVMKGFNNLPNPFQMDFSFFDVEGQHTFFTSQIQRKPSPWATMKDAPTLSRENAAFFSLNGKGYITCGTSIPGNANVTDTWEYDPGIDQWTRKADFPAPSGTGAAAFVIGSKAYVVFPSTTHFWSFDPVNNIWTQLPYFPGASAGASSFVTAIGTKGYVTGANRDLWEYDPATNSWTQKQTVPITSTQGDVFYSNGNKGVLHTLDDQGNVKSCLYDPSTNSWQTISTTFKPAFDHFNLYPLVFSSQTYLVDAISGITYKVNGTSEPWSFAGYGAIADKNGGFSLVINGKGYIGLGEVIGQSTLVSSSMIVQFDPSKF